MTKTKNIQFEKKKTTRHKYIYECVPETVAASRHNKNTDRTRALKQQQTILCIRSISLAVLYFFFLSLFGCCVVHMIQVAFQLWTNLSLVPHAEKVASLFSWFFFSFLYFVGVAQLHTHGQRKIDCSLHWIRKNFRSNLPTRRKKKKPKTFSVHVCVLLWGLCVICCTTHRLVLPFSSTLSSHEFIIDVFDTNRCKMLAFVETGGRKANSRRSIKLTKKNKK